MVLCSGVLITGCGSNNTQDAAVAAQHQERQRLQNENQELAQARADNQEVQRLKTENQELPKARSQYQEAARLKKDNEQLRQQIARIAPAAASAQAHPNPGTHSAPTPTPAEQELKAKELAALEAATVHEGDDILIEPKYLKQLLPEFDWEKLDRKEPLAVRSLLEKDGVQITNTAQLHEYGITNFVIQRAPQVQQAQPQEAR